MLLYTVFQDVLQSACRGRLRDRDRQDMGEIYVPTDQTTERLSKKTRKFYYGNRPTPWYPHRTARWIYENTEGGDETEVAESFKFAFK
jgi:hypothetical protein